MNESMPSSAQPAHAAQNPRTWFLVSMRGPVEDATRAFGGNLIALHRELAVHDHVSEPDRVLVRLVVDGAVGDGGGIEHDDVRLHAGAQQAAIPDFQPLGGVRRHAADGLFEREYVLLADIDAEDAREGPIAARMRRG